LRALHPHPVIPTLAALRDQVLQRDRNRKPKWRFRLAPDLIVQLQPWGEHARLLSEADSETLLRLDASGDERHRFVETHALRLVRCFKGEAIIGRDDVASFARAPAGESPWSWLYFAIYADAAGAWLLRLEIWRSSGAADTPAALGRLRAALQPERFATLDPDLLLQTACLICGRPLTDPASLARWIGPECFGTGSLVVPRTSLL
jgi:hypothetical protein